MGEKLKQIVSDILSIPVSQIDGELSPETNGHWDSINHLNIITAVEAEFGISFSMADIQGIHNYASLETLVIRALQL